MARRRRLDHDEELRRVYRVHVRAVYAFLSYSVGAHTAEDLTSATFERVVKAWPSFDPHRASERTWILAIARNALTDYYRRQALRRTVSTDEHPLLLDALTSADASTTRMSVERIKSWLEHLSAREQEILALRYGAELQASEVADLTELSVDNVHQITSRALRKLRAVTSDEISDSA